MKNLKNLLVLAVIAVFLGVAQIANAQNVRIVSPEEGKLVRGEFAARFEGLPTGGYAMVYMDGKFVQATSQDSFLLDTLGDRALFPRGDGTYKLSINVRNASGKQAGEASVSFRVGNSEVTEGGEKVPFAVFTESDRLDDNVQRYRVFAESNANIEGGGAEGGAEGGAAGGGAEGGGEMWIPAPLDWQFSALLRRIVRDVNMFSDDPKNRSANIRTVVQEGFQRQRLSESGGAAGGEAAAAPTTSRRKKSNAPTVPVKAPWNQTEKGSPIWERAPETGQYFVKMVMRTGAEINATRKAPTIAIADLLPTFPDSDIQPGSTWTSKMTLLGELSAREPVNVEAPVTFTAFETIQTPGGETRRAAKLESRFRLPENLSKQIAISLIEKGGGGAETAGGGAQAEGLAGAAEAESELLPEDIKIARSDVVRVLWFDVQRRRVLRSEDNIRTYYEYEPLEAEGAVGGGAAAGGEAAAPVEPTKVNYNLKVTTWMDDRIPAPTERYAAGAGTAHSRDSATEPSISKITKKNGP